MSEIANPNSTSNTESQKNVPGAWTFFTNHAHVMILLAKSPDIVLREVAMKVGITERAVQKIVSDLEETGFIQKEKQGRSNRYQLNLDKPLRHPIESHKTVKELIALINSRPD
jgi:predicted transcriptional regulator